MTQTQLEEFRKWVEEKVGREVEIKLTSRNAPLITVWDPFVCASQIVTCVDEISLETIKEKRDRALFEELKKKFYKEEKQ